MPSLAETLAQIPPDQLQAFQQAAQWYGMNPLVPQAVAATETGGTFNPNLRSPAGAMGLMQLMPPTARAYNVANPYDPAQSIWGGAANLAEALKWAGGRLGVPGGYAGALGSPAAMADALRAYNNGPDTSRWNNPETQRYPQAFLQYYNALKDRQDQQGTPPEVNTIASFVEKPPEPPPQENLAPSVPQPPQPMTDDELLGAIRQLTNEPP